MDFGSFLNDVGRNIGNFFGVGQKKKRPDQPQPTVTVTQPNPLLGNNFNAPGTPAPTVQQPGALVPDQNQPFHLGGVTLQPSPSQPSQFDGLSPEDKATAQNLAANGKDATKFVQAARTAKALNDKATYDNSVVGKIGNTALEVGRTLGGGMIDAANFATRIPQTIDTATNQLAVNTIDNLPGMENQKRLDIAKGIRQNQLYGDLQQGIDTASNDLKGGVPQNYNQHITQEANRISSGQGTPGDIVDAIVNSLGIAATGPVIRTASTLRPSIEGISPTLTKTANTIDNLLNTKLRLPGARGPAIESAAKPDVLSESTMTPTTEGALTYEQKLANDAADTGATTLDQPIPDTPQIKVQDPNSPITTTPTVERPPAITSPNRPTPTVTQPKPFDIGVTDGTKPPVLQGVQVDSPSIVQPIKSAPTTADQEALAVKQAIDNQAVQPEPQPAPIATGATDAPTPVMPKPDAAAPETAPVNPAAVAQDMAAQEVAKAPTEAIANGMDKVRAQKLYDTYDFNGVPASVRQMMRDNGATRADISKLNKEIKQAYSIIEPDKYVAKAQDVAAQAKAAAPTDAIASDVRPADAKFNKLMAFADKELGPDGYGKLVEKLARNSETGAIPEPLTPAEQAVFDAISPHANEVRDTATRLGVGNEDPGTRKQYLPTKALDPLTEVTDTQTALQHGLGFLERRADGTGGLTPEQRISGAKQALRDMLNTGEHLKNASPETIDSLKAERLNNEVNTMVEQTAKGEPTGMALSDAESAAIRAENAKLVQAERAAKEARDRVVKGDTTPEAISAQNKAANEFENATIDKRVNEYILLEKKTDERIAQVKASNLSPAEKQKLIVPLEQHLQDVRNQTYYMQSTTRTNMLLGVGRIADQVNKGAQSVADATTGVLSKVGANKSFTKQTGRDLFADGPTTKAVWNEIKSDKRLNQGKIGAEINKRIVADRNASKGVFGRTVGTIAGKYNAFGTRLTEAGSRYVRPSKDAVSYFVSKAQAEGITDVKDIARYVQDSIGSKEWDRVYGSFYDARNKFTGVPSFVRDQGAHLSIMGKEVKFNPRGVVYGQLSKIPGLSRAVRENVADALTIPVIGFPRLLFRLGARGLDASSLGVTDFIRAARISPSNEAEALKKALLVKQGIESAQSGAALGSLGVYLGASGMTTGAYPTDPAERARWAHDKIQPFSLKIGDQYVDVSRYLGPLGMPLMLGAAIGRGEANPKDLASLAGDMAGQIMQNYGADTIGKIMSDVGGLLTGQGDKLMTDAQNWGAGIIDAFIPGASALNTAGKAQDMIQGNAQPDTSGGVVDKLRAKLPLTRDGLPAKTDSFGNPIMQGNAADLLPGVSGGQAGGQSDTPVTQELSRLAAAGVEAYPSGVQGNARDYQLKDVNNKDIALSGDQQNSLNQAIKQEKDKQASLIMQSPEYQAASDQAKGDMLKNLYSLDSSSIASQWAQDNGVKDVKQAGEKVNNGLPDTEQQALISYKLQGDKSKAWLDNTDNAANYYTAAYDNAKLNGTITKEDENLQNKSGMKYKAIEAQVNQQFGADKDLQALYNQISQSDFKDMLDPESDNYDPETATKLYHYDEARTKAGVSDAKFTDRQKYSLKAKGSGKGGRNSKSFAFASLPGSLLGTGGTGKGGNGGYADPSSLFKPIADLQAPPTVAIPKGRSISVKQGVQL